MKDYDHVIIWLDYFNKNLSRKKGRKVKRENAIFDPIFSELFDAALDEGLDVTEDHSNDHARFPRRSYVRSGYIMISKIENKSKSQIISNLATRISLKRLKNKKSK